MQKKQHSNFYNLSETPINSFTNFTKKNNLKTPGFGWLQQQLNLNIESEQTLHEKIIQLYQAIQNKTIKNIEVKKNNEVLKAQVDTYKSIIDKIKKANQANEATNKSKYSFQKNNYLLSIQNSCTNIQIKNGNQLLNQNKTQICQFSNQTFQQDQNIDLDDKEINARQSQSFENYKQNYQFDDYNKVSDRYNQISYQNQLKLEKVRQQNSQKQKKFINSLPIYSNIVDSAQQNTEQVQMYYHKKPARREIDLKYNSYNSYQNTPNYYSPRSLIDNSDKKLGTPNKSFLKKSLQNVAINNVPNKYSSINIQQLWNESIQPNNSNLKMKEKIKIVEKKQIKKTFKNNMSSQDELKKIARKIKR